MADDKLHPQQWLGRPILSPEHVQDLETRAAINEFHRKMPRQQAEQHAHDSYVKENRERAAAHHLAGMKAAMATGNHEDARKHWALYDLHLKALGKDSIGAVPPEVEKRLSGEGDKPVYKFKAHKGDLYALHEPSKDVAPAQGQPIQKSAAAGDPSYQKQWTVNHSASHGSYTTTGGLHNRLQAKQSIDVHYTPAKGGKKQHVGTYSDKHAAEAGRLEHHDRISAGFKKEELIEKSEAKQCKWRLGERRCQRMVTTGYCHDHKDHWANKIKQKEASQAEQPMEKAALPTVAPAIAPMTAPAKPAAPAGTAHLSAPAPAAAAPQLHSSVEGFVGGLKALPKGSPARGKYITQHMNHGPFLAALQAHPQGKQLHTQLMGHLNSAQNAGFKPGATVAVAKAEAREAAVQLLKAVAELAKGKLLQFPGNTAPAVDRGTPAELVAHPQGGAAARFAASDAKFGAFKPDHQVLHDVHGQGIVRRMLGAHPEGGHQYEVDFRAAPKYHSNMQVVRDSEIRSAHQPKTKPVQQELDLDKSEKLPALTTLINHLKK